VTKNINFNIIILFVIAWITMKLSLPVLPTLIEVFQTTPSKLKLSVSLFLICYASSQLIWGVLSEKFGRKPIILSGILVAIIGTLTITFSHKITTYITGRCIEGIGMGVVSPVGRAILSDVFSRKRLAKTLAVLSSITGLMPALAPIFGGFILIFMGWRTIFILFLILLISYLLFSYKKLPETHKPKLNLPLAIYFKKYLTLIRQTSFWGYIGCYAITQGILLGYYSAMPFWYVNQLNIPEQYYSFLALFTVCCYLAALSFARYFIELYSLEKILRLSLWIGFGAAAIALSFAILNISGIVPLIITMSIVAITPGITFPLANAGALSHFKSDSAMISALSTTLMFSLAAFFSWIESHLNIHTLWEIGLLLLLTNSISLITNYRWMPTEKNRKLMNF